jgi:hypothetical protein
MPVWTKILIVVAIAVILTAWGWMLDLSRHKSREK